MSYNGGSSAWSSTNARRSYSYLARNRSLEDLANHAEFQKLVAHANTRSRERTPQAEHTINELAPDFGSLLDDPDTYDEIESIRSTSPATVMETSLPPECHQDEASNDGFMSVYRIPQGGLLRQSSSAMFAGPSQHGDPQVPPAPTRVAPVLTHYGSEVYDSGQDAEVWKYINWNGQADGPERFQDEHLAHQRKFGELQSSSAISTKRRQNTASGPIRRSERLANTPKGVPSYAESSLAKQNRKRL